jgi:periplasmic copper chaperone A
MRKPTLLVAIALAASACGGGSDGVTVDDPWGRTSPMNAELGAFYMTIENGANTADRIVAGSSDRCSAIEFHNSSMDADGVMSMAPAPELFVVPAGGSLELRPAGLHVMCVGLTAPLVEGEMVELDLEFEQAGTVPVEVSVEDR